MRETCEFRIVEEYAQKLFAPNEGKKLGDSVRKVELLTNDPRFRKVGEFQREIKASTGSSFFHGWQVRRSYSNDELRNAELYLLKISSVIEPAGEECGTIFDDLSACPTCGTGAKQTSKLYLDWQRIPKGKDIVKTISGEMVVSRRFVEISNRNDLKGARFLPVCYRPTSSAESKDWFQLIIDSELTDVMAPTETGVDPFDKDAQGKYRCACGDLIGLNLLSEVWVKRVDLTKSDFVASNQFVGIRRGLLRPEQLIFVSPKFWRVISEATKLKALNIEVAHFQDNGLQ